jgi:hypothetical protein
MLEGRDSVSDDFGCGGGRSFDVLAEPLERDLPLLRDLLRCSSTLIALAPLIAGTGVFVPDFFPADL